MALTPDPEPTAEELVTLAEITMLSVDDAAAMVGADSDQDTVDAKWARTLADIESWADIVDDASDTTKIGGIELDTDKADAFRLRFRNKVRGRYGITLLQSENAQIGCVSSGAWF